MTRNSNQIDDDSLLKALLANFKAVVEQPSREELLEEISRLREESLRDKCVIAMQQAQIIAAYQGATTAGFPDDIAKMWEKAKDQLIRANVNIWKKYSDLKAENVRLQEALSQANRRILELESKDLQPINGTRTLSSGLFSTTAIPETKTQASDTRIMRKS